MPALHYKTDFNAATNQFKQFFFKSLFYYLTNVTVPLYWWFPPLKSTSLTR